MLEADDSGLAPLTDYDVGSRLGHGAFSEVYAATHIASATPCAIKRVFGDCGGRGARGGPSCRARGPDPAPAPGAREAAALARVVHPNVVRLLRTVELPHGGTALILERAATDVGALLAGAAGPLDAPLTKRIALSVLAALAAAHAAGVAHRDVKPENVLITASGRIVLGDWGQAAELPRADGASPRARSPALAPPSAPGGTRWYRPPEALAGGPPASDPAGAAAADAWGAGAVIAALLAGGPVAAAASDLGQLARLAPLLGTGPSAYDPGSGRGWEGKGDAADAGAVAAALPDAPRSARRLVARLLAPDPGARATPAAALTEPWLWEAPGAADEAAVAGAVAGAAARAAAAPAAPSRALF